MIATNMCSNFGGKWSSRFLNHNRRKQQQQKKVKVTVNSYKINQEIYKRMEIIQDKVSNILPHYPAELRQPHAVAKLNMPWVPPIGL